MSCTTNAVPEYSTRYLVLVDRHLCLTMGIGRRSCCSMGTCVGTSVDVVQSMSCPFLSFSRRSVGSRGVSDATKHHRLFIGSPTYHLFKCSSIGINNVPGIGSMPSVSISSFYLSFRPQLRSLVSFTFVSIAHYATCCSVILTSLDGIRKVCTHIS